MRELERFDDLFFRIFNRSERFYWNRIGCAGVYKRRLETILTRSEFVHSLAAVHPYKVDV